MQDIVIHISDALCASTGRTDDDINALIEMGKSFGRIETLDQAISSEKTKCQIEINNLKKTYQSTIDALNNQLETIKSNEITPEELEILTAIRRKADKEAEDYKLAIAERDTQLNTIRIENENRAATIAAMFGFSNNTI